jgi:hypothetical protein
MSDGGERDDELDPVLERLVHEPIPYGEDGPPTDGTFRALQAEVRQGRTDVISLARSVKALRSTIEKSFHRVDAIEEKSKKQAEQIVPRSEHKKRRRKAGLLLVLGFGGIGLGVWNTHTTAQRIARVEHRRAVDQCHDINANRQVLRDVAHDAVAPSLARGGSSAVAAQAFVDRVNARTPLRDCSKLEKP